MPNKYSTEGEAFARYKREYHKKRAKAECYHRFLAKAKTFSEK